MGGLRRRVVLLRRQGQHPVPHGHLAGDADGVRRSQPADRRPGKPVHHLQGAEGVEVAGGRPVDRVVRPAALEPDALRYAIASVLPEQNDTDLSDDDMIRRINEELVATWGNLVNRVLSLSDRNFDGKVPDPESSRATDQALVASVDQMLEAVAGHIEAVELRAVCGRLWTPPPR